MGKTKKNLYESIDDYLKETRKILMKYKSSWLKLKDSKFFKETKPKLNDYFTDLKKNRTPLNEVLVIKKMKEIKLCLSEILEDEGKLNESNIQLNFALQYCNNEKEKEEINQKIQMNISKIYRSNSNQIYKDENFSKTLSQISAYMKFDNENPSFLDLNDLYDFPHYYKEICKQNLTYEKEILDMFRNHVNQKIQKKSTNNSLNIEDIELLNCILCIETKEEFNILGSLLDLIKRIDFINDDHITGLAIILENPHLKNISIANIIIILETIYSKLNKLNIQDIRRDPKDNNYISLLKAMARILNLISDMSTEIEEYYIPEEIHKKLRDKISELITDSINYPLLNFHANYCFQSLLRISNAISPFGAFFKRLMKVKDGIINLYEVYQNLNPLKLYEAYSNLKEAFSFDTRDMWFDHCRQMELLIKTGGYYYLEAEIHPKFKENEIDYLYFYCVILELIREYNTIFDYLKIFKFSQKNYEEINQHHNPLTEFLDFLLRKINKNKYIDKENKYCLIHLIIDSLFEKKNELKHFLNLIEKKFTEDSSLDEIQNKKEIIIVHFDLAKIFETIIYHNLKNYSEIDENFKNIIEINNKSEYDKKERKSLINKEKFKEIFQNQLDWKLGMYNYRYERLKSKDINDFLDEKDKLYVVQRGAPSINSPEENQHNMKDYLKNDFLISKKKFLS